MGPPNSSPLLQIPRAAWTHENALAFAAPDPQPITAGHTLIITKRLVPTWFDATEAEHHALLALLAEVKATLDHTLHPDGDNVGFNAGPAAGDTTLHLHLHVIPRFHGDVDDPQGGVRNLLPPRAHSGPSPLATGGTDDPFARHLLPLLTHADRVGIVAAFVQASGLRHLEPELIAAVDRGAQSGSSRVSTYRAPKSESWSPSVISSLAQRASTRVRPTLAPTAPAAPRARRTTMSTSRPSTFKNFTSRSVENPSSRPRTNAETLG